MFDSKFLNRRAALLLLAGTASLVAAPITLQISSALAEEQAGGDGKNGDGGEGKNGDGGGDGKNGEGDTEGNNGSGGGDGKNGDGETNDSSDDKGNDAKKDSSNKANVDNCPAGTNCKKD